MRYTVRAFHAFLAVWLTVTTALPPCCWSMGSAHDHQASATQLNHVQAQGHHHHATHDAIPITVPASTITATHADDCDAQSLGAMTTTRTNVVHAPERTTESRDPVDVDDRASIASIWPHNLSPPGSLTESAFLSPLRI
jgi:hypothetical protein